MLLLPCINKAKAVGAISSLGLLRTPGTFAGAVKIIWFLPFVFAKEAPHMFADFGHAGTSFLS